MIRGRPRSSRVPIIFLTAFNKDDLHVFRGYTAGAVDYVFKPIEPLILKSKVDVFVDLYRKTEEIRRQGEEERRLLVENLRVRGEKLKTEQALRRRAGAPGGRSCARCRSRSTSRGRGAAFRGLASSSDNVERLTGFGAERFTGEDEFWRSAASIRRTATASSRPSSRAPRRTGSYAASTAGAAPTTSTASSSTRA